MGKIVATEFVTVDGVMEDPHLWQGDLFDEDAGKFKLEETMASDALLLGRVTYEGFAAAWPGRTDEAGFADKFNSMPKYVVSTTLENPEWTNSTVIRGNLAEEIAKLKRQYEQDIVIHGSGELLDSMMQEGLIDEYRLMIFPVVVGTGKRVFKEGRNANLKLVDSKTTGSGVAILTYEPAD